MGGRSDRRGPPRADQASRRDRNVSGGAGHQPGFPGTRAGLAGRAAHSRATGRGHRKRRRASGDRFTVGAPSPTWTKTGSRAARPDQRRWVGLRAQRRHLSPGAKPGAPPGCRARAPAGPRSGAAPCPAAQQSGSVRHRPAPSDRAQTNGNGWKVDVCPGPAKSGNIGLRQKPRVG